MLNQQRCCAFGLVGEHDPVIPVSLHIPTLPCPYLWPRFGGTQRQRSELCTGTSATSVHVSLGHLCCFGFKLCWVMYDTLTAHTWTVQGHLTAHAAKLAALSNLDYTLPDLDPDTAIISCNLTSDATPANQELRLVLLTGFCNHGNMQYALQLLQQFLELADDHRHLYVTLLRRLAPTQGKACLTRMSLRLSTCQS